MFMNMVDYVIRKKNTMAIINMGTQAGRIYFLFVSLVSLETLWIT